MLDYILLTIVAIVGIGGGFYTLYEAKKLKAKSAKSDSHDRPEFRTFKVKRRSKAEEQHRVV